MLEIRWCAAPAIALLRGDGRSYVGLAAPQQYHPPRLVGAPDFRYKIEECLCNGHGYSQWAVVSSGHRNV